jgi:hypothetical protein
MEERSNKGDIIRDQGNLMSKMSRLAIVAAIVASIATPALAQSRHAHRRSYYPAPGVAAPYSNYPAASAWDRYRSNPCPGCAPLRNY